MEDKLITLENLDVFLDNVIVDSSVATKSTWSSQKLSTLVADSVDNDSIVVDSSNHIALSQGVINHITGLEQRIYALEHPTTVE